MPRASPWLARVFRLRKYISYIAIARPTSRYLRDIPQVLTYSCNYTRSPLQRPSNLCLLLRGRDAFHYNISQ